MKFERAYFVVDLSQLSRLYGEARCGAVAGGCVAPARVAGGCWRRLLEDKMHVA